MGRKKSKEKSGLTTNQKVMIIVAGIGALGYFVGGPAYNTMVQDRAIIEISFGNTNEYPKQELQFDGTRYFVEIVGINRGKSQTNPSVTVIGNNANVSFDGVIWDTKLSQLLLIRPSNSSTFYRVYVQPQPEADTLSLELIVAPPSLIHEVYPIKPLNLIYQISDGGYKLIKSF